LSGDELISKPEDNELELTQEDISELIRDGEIILETKKFGKIKIRLLLIWS